MKEKRKYSETKIQEKVCATCGKTFIPAPQHVFVCNHKYYCKWTCYNHRNDKKVKKLKGGTEY